MTLSHVLAGVMTYKFISVLESIWDFSVTLLNTFLNLPAFKVLNLQSENELTIPIGTVRLLPSLFTLTHQLRAPPRLRAVL
jgi:hypothetical protein